MSNEEIKKLSALLADDLVSIIKGDKELMTISECSEYLDLPKELLIQKIKNILHRETEKINPTDNIIDLSHSYWDKETLLKSVGKVRKLFIELLANVNSNYECEVNEIGECLMFFDMVSDAEYRDIRQTDNE